MKAIRQLAFEKARQGIKVGIIATAETQDLYTNGVVKNIGSRGSEKSIARNLYAVLREFDKEEVDVIYSESFAVQGMGSAIMNRLEKAAGHHRITAAEVISCQKYHKILIVSESDTIRGPMAAELLRRQELNREYDIVSRGLVVLFPEPVNQKVEAIMASHGMDVKGYMSQPFSPEEAEKDTLILTMDVQQKQKVISEYDLSENVYTLSEFAGEEEPLAQPIGQPLPEYEKCYERIEKLIKKSVKKLNDLQ